MPQEEPTSLPPAVVESTVNATQPKLVGFTDASWGSELKKRRPVMGVVFNCRCRATAQKFKTRTINEIFSTEAKIVAASRLRDTLVWGHLAR